MLRFIVGTINENYLTWTSENEVVLLQGFFQF